MAGDWLKIEKATPDKPEVLGIARQCRINAEVAFTKCFRFWSWVDDMSLDGHVPNVTAKWIDDRFGVPGFANALAAVEWIVIHDNEIEITNFDRHLSQSAKKRVKDNERQQRSRKKVTKTSRSKRDDVVTKSVTREEKRREEKKTPLPPKGEPWATDSILNTDRFKAVWADWTKHRKEIKHALKPTTAQKQIKRMEALGHDESIRRIERAIANGWTGFSGASTVCDQRMRRLSRPGCRGHKHRAGPWGALR